MRDWLNYGTALGHTIAPPLPVDPRVRFKNELGTLIEGELANGTWTVEFIPRGSSRQISIGSYRRANITTNYAVGL